MPRPPEFWDQVKNVFDPSEVLTGNRGEQFYCEREHNPLQEMIIDFRNPARKSPVRGFLIGHRGAGKSSLLLKFLKEYATQYLILYLDAQHYLDLSQTNQIDILYLLGIAAFKAGQDYRVNPNKALLKDLERSIFSLTIYQDEEITNQAFDAAEFAKNVLCFGAEVVGPDYGKKLAESVLKPFKISSGITEKIARKRELEPKIQNIITAVNLIIAEVETNLDRRFLIVVDGLDKLSRPEQADLIFLESQALKGPLCNLIYTVPMYVFHSLRFDQLGDGCKSYFVPNIKLFKKNSTHMSYSKHDEGYNTFTEVVRTRLAEISLANSDLFEPDVLDSLIQYSGGVLRTFIAMIQEVCTQAELLGIEKINRVAAQKTIENRAVKFSGPLNRNQIKELQEVHTTKSHSGTPVSQDLLDKRYIVAYRDPGLWYDAHPLTWDKL